MTSAGFRSSTADNRVRRQGTAALLAAAASAGVRRYVVQSIPFSLHPKASRSTPFASTTLRSSPVSTRTDSPNGAGASTHGRVVGCGDRLTSVVHVHDAAAATVLAVTSGAPGIYKVVDDEPAPLRDRLPAYADSLGAKPPQCHALLPALVASSSCLGLEVSEGIVLSLPRRGSRGSR